jgi:hypothetical protein
VGTVYAQLRDPSAALRWISRAADTGFPCYAWFARDPLLDPVRQDPRVLEFMAGLQRRSDRWRELVRGSPYGDLAQ